MAYRFSFPIKGNYIDGQFKVSGDVSGEWVGKSPADFSDELGRFQYSYRAIDEAVLSARSGFARWRSLPYQERAMYLKKFQDSFKRKREEFKEVIAREVGRPVWEVETEIDSVISKVDVTIEDGLRWVQDFEVPGAVEKALGVCRRRPLGVIVVVGPFNFPAAIPCGHIMPALLAGNSVIFKPSEKAPLTAQLLADCFHEAEIPAGTFNLVQGEKEVSRRLCVHESVDSVMFTGSYEVGMRIKQDTLLQHWKLVALQMGGKNPAVIWEDADVEGALRETFFGAFVSAGQRCGATSRILVHKKLIEPFVEKFHERAKAFVIGHPLENPFMGPMIDAGAADRYMKFQGVAAREGCDLVMRGKTLELAQQGNYVAPSICLVQNASLEASKKSVYQQAEIFGPNVAILSVEDLDEAIAQANITQFGLSASVFSKSRAVYEKCWDGLQAGLINWNCSTTLASSRLPYGGRKKSGNHFPSAVLSMVQCTYPVSSLESAEVVSGGRLVTGLNWK